MRRSPLWKITVLDCNTAMFPDAIIEKQLYPHSLMIPYLVRQSGQPYGCDAGPRYAFERPKGLSQSEDPLHCGLMSVLLMATHAVYGIEACKNIHVNILAKKGRVLQ